MIRQNGSPPAFKPANPRLLPWHPINRGLTAAWMLGELAGTYCADLMGSSPGTLSTSTRTTQAGHLGGAAPYLSGGGSGPVINVGYGDSVRPTVAMSIQGWARLTSTSYGGILASETTHSTLKGFQLWTAPGGQNFEVGNGSNRILASYGVPPLLNQWLHYVGTFDGTNTRIYINGYLRGTSSASFGPIVYTTRTSTTQDTRIGQGALGTLTGTIDNVRMWNRVLSLTEIRQLYAMPYLGLASNAQRTFVSLGGSPDYLFPPAAVLDVAGGTPSLLFGTVVAPAAGTEVFAGQTNALSFGTRLAPASGVEAVNGQSADLLFGSSLAPATGTEVFTGQTNALGHGIKLTPAAAAEAFAGQSADLVFGSRLAPGAGTETATGQSAVARVGTRLSPVAGVETATGQAPFARVGTKLSPAAGVETFAGSMVAAGFGIKLSPAAGVVAFISQTVSAYFGAVLAPATATVTFAGAAPALQWGTALAPISAELPFTGLRPKLVGGPTETPDPNRFATVEALSRTVTLFVEARAIYVPATARTAIV